MDGPRGRARLGGRRFIRLLHRSARAGRLTGDGAPLLRAPECCDPARVGSRLEASWGSWSELIRLSIGLSASQASEKRVDLSLAAGNRGLFLWQSPDLSY